MTWPLFILALVAILVALIAVESRNRRLIVTEKMRLASQELVYAERWKAAEAQLRDEVTTLQKRVTSLETQGSLAKIGGRR